jgi:hypothetical protein
MRRILLTIVLCAACSSSDEAPGGDDSSVECEPTDETIDLAEDHGWALQAMTSDERGPWSVLERRRDGASSLVIADRTGEVATLVSGLDHTAGMAIAPLVVDGKRCIALHLFDEKLQFACEGGTVETPGLDIAGRLAAVQGADASVHVFGQDFAAYHELRRDGGVWREIEKFESSVSSAEDAVALGASVASCFRSTGGFPSIDIDDDIAYGTEPAQWCRLLPGTELGVLTDLGLTTFSNNKLGAWVSTALEQRPLAVDGAVSPVAVVHREDRVELQPLPSGTPTVLRTLASAENAHAAIRGDRVFLISVKPILDPDRTRYQLVSSTRCLQ